MRSAGFLCAFGLAFVVATPSLAARTWSEGQALTYTSGSFSMPYRLYLPKNYSAANDYPVVLFMHGSGERGTNNQSQVNVHIAGLIDRTYELYPSILIAPQIPANHWWGDANYDLTIGILDQVKQNYGVDQRRIYGTGLSMGGFGTTDYAYMYRNLFAAIAPMSGAQSYDANMYQTDLGKLPTWLFHGSSDTSVSVTYSRDYYLDATGLSSISFGSTFYGYPTAIKEPIRYTELTGQGHVIWNNIYANSSTALYDWMFAQSQPVPEPSAIGLVVLATAVAGGLAAVRSCRCSWRRRERPIVAASQRHTRVKSRH